MARDARDPSNGGSPTDAPTETPALPFEIGALPDTYTDLREELEWYAGEMGRNGDGFADVAEVLAGDTLDDDSDATPFEQLYQAVRDAEDSIRDRMDDDQRATMHRALRLCVALENRLKETRTLRRYKDGKPGTIGSWADSARVTADANLAVYRLTEKSAAVWHRQITYHGGLFAFGAGTFDVAFPPDVDAWVNREYGEYLTPAEARERKADARSDST